MLKKASGADEGGFFSRAWGRLSARRARLLWYVVVPLLVAVTASGVALLAEYGVFRTLWEPDPAEGHHQPWAVMPTANVQGTEANGEVWVAADGKVHVTGVLEDVKGDGASAEVRLVPHPRSQKVRLAEVGEGAGNRGYISGAAGATFDAVTSEVEAVACTHNRSAGSPSQCAPPQVIYDTVDYREREH